MRREGKKFGFSILDRQSELKNAKRTGTTERISDFQGKPYIDLPIISVPIELPKYRVVNGRTASAQLEFVAKKGLSADYFDKEDPELYSVQINQHEILKEMTAEEGLKKKFKDPLNRQVNPIILDENGFVINGNRRLCCWRELFYEDETKYSHFRYIDVVVLPHCTERELNYLEAKLQISKDIKSDYSWDAEANMYLAKMKRNELNIDELCALYGKKKTEIESLLGARELAKEYLESRSKPEFWSEVRSSKYAFDKLYKSIQKLTNQGDKELFKALSFLMIDDTDKVGDRLYETIPQIKQHFDIVVRAVSKELKVVIPESDSANDLFGNPLTVRNVKGSVENLVIAQEISKDADKANAAREAVLREIRNQESLKSEDDRSKYLSRQLKDALTNLSNAAGHGLRPESSKTGVLEQIESLRSYLVTIEKWLRES